MLPSSSVSHPQDPPEGDIPLEDPEFGSLFSYSAAQHQTFVPLYNQQDLTRLCQRLMVKQEYFGPALLSVEVIERLHRDQISTSIQQLATRVDELARMVAFLEFPQAQPEIVLRSPPLLYQLFFLIDFSGLQSDKEALFQDKTHTIARVCSVLTQQVKNTMRAVDVATALNISFPEYLHTHLRHISAVIEILMHEVDSAESLYEWIRHAVIRTGLVIRERLTLLSSIRRCLKPKLVELSNFVYLSSMPPFQQVLDQEPSFGQEEAWFTIVEHCFETMRPYFRIVECMCEFLRPYLEGAISPETENVFRPEVRQWLLPKIRSEFPDFSASDDEIEIIALSAYLGMGARGLNLKTLKQTYEFFSDGIDVRLFQHDSAEAMSLLLITHPQALRAIETEKTAREAFGAYQDALLHALKIDFRSLGLLDKEITLLAKNHVMHPTIPLGELWRSELAYQILAHSQRRPHPFPWD